MTTRYPRARVTIMDMLVSGIPISMDKCEMANNANARAMYSAITIFLARKTQMPNITMITAKTKFNITVGSIAIFFHLPFF